MCQKYSVVCCEDEVKKAFIDYKLASYTDCEVPIDKLCTVLDQEITDYTVDCGSKTISEDCSTQVNLVLSKINNTITYTPSLSNPDSNNGFMKVVLADNSIYHKGTINLKLTGSDGSISTTAVTTGNFSGSISGVDYDIAAVVACNVDNLKSYPSGYLNNFVFYSTNSQGVLNPFPLILDISPSNLSAWTSCGACSGISASDLLFGSANFVTAFNTLMVNISKTLYGNTTSCAITVAQGVNNGYFFKSFIKHNPSSEYFGFDPQKSTVVYFNNGTVPTQKILTPFQDIYVLPQNGQVHQVVNSTIACGSNSTLVKSNNQPIKPSVNAVESNFNKIVLYSTNTQNGPTIVSSTPLTCVSYTLTATTTSTDISSVT
jgi:hypothetical protein